MKPKNKNRLFRKIGMILILAACLPFLSIIPSTIAQDSESLIPAPLNPDFLEYLHKVQTYGFQMETSNRYALGLIPGPLDLSHLTGEQLPQIHELAAAPLSYDLRSLGKVTPVKNQGACGSCWSFATYGSLESTLLPSETWDFSENNLKDTHGFDAGHCSGGNADMSTAYLARWSGPVNESDDPYNPNSNVSPPGLPIRKHLQEVLIIPDRANPLDNENIKQAIMTYGALYTHMYWNSAYYNSTYKAYYYNGGTNINHAVAIVGWDDNFDKNNFSVIPPDKGAFIIRNSWGTGWGENGYFYISYYDTRVGTSNYLFNWAESTTNYNYIYQYDPLGWVSNLGYSGTDTAWFANIFTSVANDLLKAVSFYTPSLNSTYEIYIYLNATSGPTSGTLAGSLTGTIPSPGYHTISLSSPIPLTLGQNFSVVVRLTTPGYNYPIPYERPFSNYSSQAEANPGESYISSNGNSWSDVTESFPNSNVCLKAFTIPDTVPPSIQITIPTLDPAYSTTQPTISIGGMASDNAGVTQVTWSNDRGGSGTTTGTTSWFVNGITLFSGQNILTVRAWDAANNQSTDSVAVTYSSGEAIFTPNAPSGPTTGAIGTSYSYTTGGSTSDLGHSVQYLFDWGDGTNSGWLAQGSTSASHSWSSPGTFLVKTQARCGTHISAVSTWSGTRSVDIEAVSTPGTPSGPSRGVADTTNTYLTAGSSSNFGHPIQYFFDWGDGTNSGWLPVGQISTSKTWSSVGTYSVKVQARCSTHTSAISAWSGTRDANIELGLQSPSDAVVFNSAFLITNYQPTFTWTVTGTYSGFKILFSTSPADFTTRGIKVAAGGATGTSNSWRPSSSNWKKIMKSSNNNGSIRPIYWKIVGTKADKTIVESGIRSFTIGTPQTVTINAPLDGAILDSVTLPAFEVNTTSNRKFRLEISSLSDFSILKDVKGVNVTVSDPNLFSSFQKTLSSSQWNGVKQLIGTGTGYFRIKAWDGLSRLTISDVRTFTIQ
jgi:C1A family cysteine protease